MRCHTIEPKTHNGSTCASRRRPRFELIDKRRSAPAGSVPLVHHKNHQLRRGGLILIRTEQVPRSETDDAGTGVRIEHPRSVVSGRVALEAAADLGGFSRVSELLERGAKLLGVLV